MAVELKHNFQSAKADGPDSTVVQPSDWNENHNLTLGAGKVLGRASGTAGAVQELPLAFDSTLQSMIPPTGSTAQRPAVPTAGMIRYNSTLGQLEMYRAGAWSAIGGSAYVGTVAPSSPNAGDLWFNTTTAQLTTYNGTSWALSTINAAAVSYTGDGSQVTFSLGVSPGSKNNTNVFISGVYQAKANYSVSGTNIIFSTAPPLGAAIEISFLAATTIQVPADGSVTLASIDSAFTTFLATKAPTANPTFTGNIVLNGSAASGVTASLQVRAGNNDGASTLAMGDSDSASIASISYSHSNDYMSFIVNGGTRFRLGAAGEWGIGSAYGTAGQVLTSGGTGAAPSWSYPVTPDYESAQQTITYAGNITLTHGLGARPSDVQVWLVCTTADAGYSVGDWYGPIGAETFGDGANNGVGIAMTSTSIKIVTGAQSVALVNWSTGIRTGITTTSWKYVARAWK
jgi:hypothetical protein